MGMKGGDYTTYDQLSQEDFLVRVKGVDDQVQQLGDLGLEAAEVVVRLALPVNEAQDLPKGFRLSGHFCRCR